MCTQKWVDLLGGTSLSAAKGVVDGQTTPFAALRDVPPWYLDAASKSSYDAPNDFATLLNVVLVDVPTALIAVRQTITIKASMTAYSTAVGPSSDTRKRRSFKASRFMGVAPMLLVAPLLMRMPRYLNPRSDFSRSKSADALA